MESRKAFGNLAEEVAARFIQQRGYKILARNYHKPWGEIDIIAQKDDVVIFIEVKANAKDMGAEFNPEVRADSTKMRKVIKTAMLYLKNLEQPWRIDVISVTMDQQKAKITHFKNVSEAFS